jgi:hypothetical protein
MEQTRYASRLRYLDAGDLDDSTVDFDGLDVRGDDGAHLGDVDGFLVDPSSGRVLYTVVDSGGWFTSRRFLLPIGHVTIDGDAGAMRVDVSREALRSFPEFDERNFRDYSDEDLRSYEHRMIEVCCPDDEAAAAPGGVPNLAARHYRQPEWWKPEAFRGDRLHPIEPRPFKGRHAAAPPAADVRSQSPHDRARDDEGPHFGGRAQPGDVLGLETGGERTYVGDTAEDEDDRRRAAERAAREDEPTER